VAFSAKRVETFTVEAEEKPGALATLTEQFVEKNINIFGIWGSPSGPGRSQIWCLVDHPEIARQILKRWGTNFKERTACLISGKDRVGALHEVLEKLTPGGHNISCVQGISLGDPFVMVMWPEEGNEEAFCKCLGC